MELAKARTGGAIEAREMDGGDAALRVAKAAAQRLPFLPIRAGRQFQSPTSGRVNCRR